MFLKYVWIYIYKFFTKEFVFPTFSYGLAQSFTNLLNGLPKVVTIDPKEIFSLWIFGTPQSFEIL